MSNDTGDGRYPAFSQGLVAPIAGLLSVLFAVLAGISAYPAVSGASGALAIPIIFGIASILFMYLRQRYTGGTDDEGEA